MEMIMNVNDYWTPTVWVDVWEDDCGNPCVYIKNMNDEYLSCHEDGKHVFWNDVQDDDAWTWEMWYPEVCEDKIFLKSYHDTYMKHGEDQDIWQTDERSNVYFEDFELDAFENMMNGINDDEDVDDVEDDDVEDDKCKTPNAYDQFVEDHVTSTKNKKDTCDDEKVKRTISPEVQKKAAIARKIKSYIESECKSEFDGLKGKEKTAKKTELYQKHKKENSDLYKKLYKKAEKEV